MSDSAKEHHQQPAPGDRDGPSLDCDAEIAFVRRLADEMRTHLKARMEGVNTWREGDEASHRAAHRLAERMGGRKMPYVDAAGRERLAQIDEKIGNQYAAEIALLERIERLLVGSATDSSQRSELLNGQERSAKENHQLDDLRSVEETP